MPFADCLASSVFVEFGDGRFEGEFALRELVFLDEIGGTAEQEALGVQSREVMVHHRH